MIVYGTVITHIALKIALPFLILSPSGRCRLSNFRFKDVRIMQDDPSLNFTCGYCRLFMDVRNLRGDLSVYCFNLSFFFNYLFFHFLFNFNNNKYFRCSNSLGHWFGRGTSFDSASPESIRPSISVSFTIFLILFSLENLVLLIFLDLLHSFFDS